MKLAISLSFFAFLGLFAIGFALPATDKANAQGQLGEATVPGGPLADSDSDSDSDSNSESDSDSESDEEDELMLPGGTTEQGAPNGAMRKKRCGSRRTTTAATTTATTSA